MKKVLLAVVFGFLPMVSACGGVAPESGVEESQQAQHICPLYVPLCEAPCHLAGACMNQCHCPGNLIKCGNSHCNAQTQVCCLGAINTYTCVDGNVCTL
jgi:hypothetical protein